MAHWNPQLRELRARGPAPPGNEGSLFAQFYTWAVSTPLFSFLLVESVVLPSLSVGVIWSLVELYSHESWFPAMLGIVSSNSQFKDHLIKCTTCLLVVFYGASRWIYEIDAFIGCIRMSFWLNLSLDRWIASVNVGFLESLLSASFFANDLNSCRLTCMYSWTSSLFSHNKIVKATVFSFPQPKHCIIWWSLIALGRVVLYGDLLPTYIQRLAQFVEPVGRFCYPARRWMEP